jgi:hypothetical protein
LIFPDRKNHPRKRKKKDRKIWFFMALYFTMAYIVEQIDERLFLARLSETDAIVKCYLSHQLFYRNINPLLGDLVKLEYNSGLWNGKRRVQNIVDILYSKKKQDKFKKNYSRSTVSFI